jgi:hypothetical protein
LHGLLDWLARRSMMRPHFEWKVLFENQELLEMDFPDLLSLELKMKL